MSGSWFCSGLLRSGVALSVIADSANISSTLGTASSIVSDEPDVLFWSDSSIILSSLFFRSVTTTAGDDNKIEAITDNISGSLRRVNGTVTVASATTIGQQHGLSLNDEFELHVTSNKTQTFDLRYNENIRKLVVNPVSFADSAIGIGTTVSKITISDHNFETGDLIVYNSASFLGFEITKKISIINIAAKMFFVVTVPVIFGMIVRSFMTVSYTHLTLPTSDLV